MTPNEKKKIEKYLKKKIDRTPEQFYQAHGLLKAILDDKNYLHINVSNRRDGKSFTTTDILSDLMIKFGFKVCFLAHDERSRVSYFNQMIKVFKEGDNDFKEEFLEYRNIQRWYLNVYYQSEHIATIIDYSEIESLKNESAFLSMFDFIFYDEFIMSSYRYLRTEYIDLKTLFKSINRPNKTRKNKLPKILLAGNAVNFDSPILSGFDLLNLLETQELNTSKQYHRKSVNLIIEKHKNEHSNVAEENDIFPDEAEDPNALGDFVFNNYNIKEKSPLMECLVIDLNDSYLYVYYTKDMKNILYELKGYSKTADFCISKNNEDETTMYLTTQFFGLPSKFEKLPITYVNSYTKTFVTADSMIQSLKIFKVISYHMHNLKKLHEPTDEEYNENIIQSRARYNLSKEFNLETNL